MGKSKKTNKKKGCLGLLFNVILLVACLMVTGLLFYFAMMVIKGNPDPVGEMKKLPEQLKVLPETIKSLIEKKSGDDASTE